MHVNCYCMRYYIYMWMWWRAIINAKTIATTKQSMDFMYVQSEKDYSSVLDPSNTKWELCNYERKKNRVRKILNDV